MEMDSSAQSPWLFRVNHRHPCKSLSTEKHVAVGGLLVCLLAVPCALHGVFHMDWPCCAVPSASHSHPLMVSIANYLENTRVVVGRYLHCNEAFAPLSLRLFNLFIYVGLALLCYLINLFLTSAIGGLAVYLGSDTLSENFAARSQILSECTATVTSLLSPMLDDLPQDTDGRQQYDRVFIAAHSLGSVIAYDVLNDLMVKNLASGSPKGLERIAGLFTFGCPLNKTYYFFRTRTDEKTTVLNEILFSLHNFRLRVPPPSEAASTPSPFSSAFKWFNAWSPYDFISGRMLFYQADSNQVVTAAHEPAMAHIGYWEDPNLYRFFAGLL